jgi:hypothetical protein
LPLTKPLFHLNSQFSARSRYHSITLEKTVSNPRAIKTTPIAMRKLSCLSDTSSITADPAIMTISPIEPRILYRLNQSGIAGSPYNRFDMLPSRWTFRPYVLLSRRSRCRRHWYRRKEPMAMRIEPTIIPKICGMMMTNPSVSCWIESRATRKKIVLAAAISRPIAMIVFAVRHISLPSGISLSVISASPRPYGLFSTDFQS